MVEANNTFFLYLRMANGCTFHTLDNCKLQLQSFHQNVCIQIYAAINSKLKQNNLSKNGGYIKEAAKKSLFSGPANERGEGVKAGPLRKNNFF